jgi:hypothetical protein
MATCELWLLGNLAREIQDRVLAETPGSETPRTYVRGYGVCNLARKSGDGLLANTLGAAAPRQSEVTTMRTEVQL